jgi:uncharacterized protein involved in propanediol utilization
MLHLRIKPIPIPIAERSSEHSMHMGLNMHRERSMQFDEATWERVESPYGEANAIELVQSTLTQDVGEAAATSDVRHAVLSVLKILCPT